MGDFELGTRICNSPFGNVLLATKRSIPWVGGGVPTWGGQVVIVLAGMGWVMLQQLEALLHYIYFRI